MTPYDISLTYLSHIRRPKFQELDLATTDDELADDPTVCLGQHCSAYGIEKTQQISETPVDGYVYICQRLLRGS